MLVSHVVVHINQIIQNRKYNLQYKTLSYCSNFMENSTTLILNKICPFAHRAWLTLLEKDCNFALKEASLTNKEPWFTETYKKAFGHDPNSDGKVPILVHGDDILTQSDLIAWYVAETFTTGNQLIPKQPFQRAKLRKFIQDVPSKLIGAFYSTIGFNKKNEDQKAQVLKKIEQGLQIVEKEIAGPYVLGEQFSLADIFIYPWFERWVVNEKLFGITLPENLPKIHGFIKALQARPSVKKSHSEVSEQFYVKGYEGFMKK